MGSKTPDGDGRGPDGPNSTTSIANVNSPKKSGANGLLQDDLGGDEDGDDDDDIVAGCGTLNDAPEETDEKKKKRKKRPKKKKAKNPTEQSSPPRVLLAALFPREDYPAGELVDYGPKDDDLSRSTGEELRHLKLLEPMDDDFLKDYRQAAEIHRQVRAQAQRMIKPGASLTDVAHEIEEGVRALTGHQGIEPGDPLKAGMGFPTGLCLNNIAAHWTPNAGAKDVVLKYDDVLKVDFGVHVNGRIVDSAFTMAFNPVYDNLLAAAKDATNTGLLEAGIDARISHISACIQEAMESYEVELDGKTIPVRSIRNITGHNILRYRIHGGKYVPFVKSNTRERMEEGEVFAIETFGSTGKAVIHDDVGIYGYGRNEDATGAGLHSASAKALLKAIDQNFGTIVFAKRYLDRVGVKNYLLPMKTLISQGIMDVHVPLSDVPGSYVAQFEHTVLLRPNCKEIISRGDDY